MNPAFKTKPYEHQQECFDRFKDSAYVAILADMGTGKSKMAIDIVNHKYLKGLHDRVIVIAPVAVGPQWHSEQLPQHCAAEYESHVYKSGSLVKNTRAQNYFFANCKNNDNLMFYMINFEAFVKTKGTDLVKRFASTSNKPPAFIIDEASRIKNPEAKSVVNIERLAHSFPGAFRIVMTGTPAAKSPVDMYSIFNFLERNYMGCSYLAFQHNHEIQIDRQIKLKKRLVTIRTNIDPKTQVAIRRAIAREKKNGAQHAQYTVCRKFGLTTTDYDVIANNEDFVRFKNVEKLQKYIAKDTFAVSKDDCLDLPEKVYKVIKFEMNANQKKLIKQLATHSVAEHAGEHITISTKALLGTRVLQICGGNLAVHTEKDGVFDTIKIEGTNAKLNYIINDLYEVGSQQVIVWATFTAEIEMLERELGKKFTVSAMNGKTPKNKRAEIVEEFKAGVTQVLISHPAVGGYGLNLQNAGVQYWYSRDYRTESRLQAEDRSHRIGTVRSPVYKDLLYNSAFEHSVLDVLREGQDMNSKFVTTDLNDLFAFTKR